MIPKLLALAKVCSALGNIHDSSHGICQSVGVSLRKGEHFPFWTKMVCTKIKPAFVFFALVVLDQDDVGEGLSALAAAVHHDSIMDSVNMLLVLGHVGNLEVVARPTSLVVGAHLLQVHAILVLAIEDFTTGGATVLSFWVLA